MATLSMGLGTHKSKSKTHSGDWQAVPLHIICM